MGPLTYWECTHCSTKNNATSPFCISCGAAMSVTGTQSAAIYAQQTTQPMPAYTSGLNASSAGPMQAPPISLADLGMDAHDDALDDVSLAGSSGMLQQQKVSSRRPARRGLVSRRELIIGLAGVAATGGLLVAVYQWSRPKPAVTITPTPNAETIPTPLGVNSRLLASQNFSLAWSSDGVYLVCSCAGGNLVVKKAATDDTLVSDTTNAINDIAWSPLSSSLACACDDGTVQIRQMPQDAISRTYRDHNDPVQTLSWTHNGKYIASADLSPAVNVWEAATLRTISSYKDVFNGQVTSLAWSPDGKRLACGCADNSVLLLDVAKGQLIATNTQHQQPVEAVSWSPDGRYLASASDDRSVQILSPDTGNTIVFYTGHTDKVWRLAWSPDSQFLASGSWDKTVRIWKPDDKDTYQLFTEHQDRVVSLAWSNQGRIASVDASGTILLWGVINRSSGES